MLNFAIPMANKARSQENSNDQVTINKKKQEQRHTEYILQISAARPAAKRTKQAYIFQITLGARTTGARDIIKT